MPRPTKRASGAEEGEAGGATVAADAAAAAAAAAAATGGRGVGRAHGSTFEEEDGAGPARESPPGEPSTRKRGRTAGGGSPEPPSSPLRSARKGARNEVKAEPVSSERPRRGAREAVAAKSSSEQTTTPKRPRGSARTGKDSTPAQSKAGSSGRKVRVKEEEEEEEAEGEGEGGDTEEGGAEAAEEEEGEEEARDAGRKRAAARPPRSARAKRAALPARRGRRPAGASNDSDREEDEDNNIRSKESGASSAEEHALSDNPVPARSSRARTQSVSSKAASESASLLAAASSEVEAADEQALAAEGEGAASGEPSEAAAGAGGGGLDADAVGDADANADASAAPTIVGKRGRGRPRKNPETTQREESERKSRSRERRSQSSGPAAEEGGPKAVAEVESNTGDDKERDAGTAAPAASGEEEGDLPEGVITSSAELIAAEEREGLPPVDMTQHFPERVLALREALDIPMAALFRECRLVGGATNSAYCWVRREHLHRAAMQAAGRALARWYEANVHRAPPGWKPPTAPPPGVGSHLEVAPPSPSHKEERKTERSHSKPSRLHERGNATGPVTFLPKAPAQAAPPKGEGVKLGESGDWEVSVQLGPMLVPTLVAQFAVYDDATHAYGNMRMAVAEQIKLLRQDKDIAAKELADAAAAQAAPPPQQEEQAGHPQEQPSHALEQPPQAQEQPPQAQQEQPPQAQAQPPQASACDAGPLCMMAAPAQDTAADGPAPSPTEECICCPRRLHQACYDREMQAGSVAGVAAARRDGDRTLLCPNCLRLTLEAVRSRMPLPPQYLEAAGGAAAASARRGARPRRAAAHDESGAAEGQGVGDAAGAGQPFPISASYIKAPQGSHRPTRAANRGLRRKDGSDVSSNTVWLGEGYVDGTARSRCRVYYTGFSFLDEPLIEYRVLDRVLLFRISPDGEEEEEDDEEEPAAPQPSHVDNAQHHHHHHTTSSVTVHEEGSSGAADAAHAPAPAVDKAKVKAPDFYVGQIEELWEEPDGARKARIAWFFWPTEAQLGPDDRPEPDELFSSNEVDVVSVSSIAAKVEVLTYDMYVRRKSVSSEETGGGDAGGGDAFGDSSSGMLLSDELGDALELLARQPSTRSSHSEDGPDAAAEKDIKLELGTQLRRKYRDKIGPASQRTLFTRLHFHYRAAVMVNRGSFGTGSADGKDAWLHSFLLATRDAPDSSLLLSAEAAASVCDYSLGVADAPADPLLENMHVQTFDEVLASAPRCSFCSEDMPFTGHIVCAVCTGVALCFDCFATGRQGVVHQHQDGGAASEPAGGARHAVRMMHRCSHPYRVARPMVDYGNPELAVRAIEWMCLHHGLASPVLELVGVVRGPLSVKELRGPSVRFRYAASLKESLAGAKARAERRKSGAAADIESHGPVCTVLGSRYGRSVLEAKGIACVDALLAVFGVSNKLNVPVLGSEWRAREAIRLIDSLGVHSLAWEPAAEVVGHKDALACSEFFTSVLHPAWAAQNERARALLGVVSSREANARSRERYAGAVPPASAPAVEAALADALDWGRKVHEMTVRRSKGARRAKRGLAFAVVDGQTVFARRPDEFGPRVTAETDDVLRLAVQDPASLAVDERALLEATGNAGPRVGGRTQQRTSACTVCSKNDRVHLILLCDGCDAEYHTTCLVPPLAEVPTTDWFCQDCIADREYLYDHASWGDAGRTLVRLASQHGVWTAKGEAAKPLEKRIREWQDNDVVIKRASQRALELGFGDLALPPPDKHQRHDDAAADKPHLLEEPIVKRKPGRPKVKPPATDPPAPPDKELQQAHAPAANPHPHHMSLPDLARAAQQFAWASRHHAAHAVANLEAANKGLGEALAIVTAQRNTLLDVLRKTTSQESI